MVQKVNPNLAQGVIGVPSNMYFQIMMKTDDIRVSAGIS